MNYQLCENITWKQSIQLLKRDLYAQRVYITLWGMTKDVIFLTLTVCGIASLVIMIPALLNPLGTWLETICVILFVPLIGTLPLIWICAYFGWYKNVKKINSILKKVIYSLDGVDSIKKYMPIAYMFKYKDCQLHLLFKENEMQGQTISVAKGKLLVALAYRDRQKRNLDELFNEMTGYLKGKLLGDFSATEYGLMYSWQSKYIPSSQTLTEAMDQLIYLAQRFSLEILVDEEDS